mmetsp:Transcript_16329/g.14251  ORF Transcript_16329/g.14251 Transcript_16329/m.14251 type:complete len:98 (-) Transcript_16329:258-551(-)
MISNTSPEDERHRRILEKQVEKEAKLIYSKVPNLSSNTHRNNFKDTIRSQIDILDNTKRNKYLEKLEEKEVKYWEKKQNEKLRIQRFKEMQQKETDK